MAAFDKVNQRTQVLSQANALLASEMNKAGDVIMMVLAPALEEVIAHYGKVKNGCVRCSYCLQNLHSYYRNNMVVCEADIFSSSYLSIMEKVW